MVAPQAEQFAQQNSGIEHYTVGMDRNIDYVRDMNAGYGLVTPVPLVDINYELSAHHNIGASPVWVLMDATGYPLRAGTRVDDRLRDAVAAALG